jgi:transposase
LNSLVLYFVKNNKTLSLQIFFYPCTLTFNRAFFMKKIKIKKKTQSSNKGKKVSKRKKKISQSSVNQYYILEFKLNLSREERDMIDKIFGGATNAYNAYLGEALRRLCLMKQSKKYKIAKNLDEGPEKNRLFSELRELFGFSEYAMHTYAKENLDSWLGEHVGSQLGQVLATRAFRAVEKVCYGLAKKVRFKNKNSLGSIEQKSNTTGFRWNSEKQCFMLKKHEIEITYDPKDEYIRYLLAKNDEIKFCRLVRRTIRGKTVYFGQLIVKGRPLTYAEKQFLKNKDPLKVPQNQDSNNPVGLDVGPSTIAIVSEKEARLLQFCDDLKDKSAEIRVLERSIDRKRRKANPGNYDEKGRIKKGRKTWNKSENQKKVETKKVEIQRKQAAHRKDLHGQLVNQIIAISPFINIEKLSYRSFQKNFGRSVGSRAPGMFIEKLKRVAENAGGAVLEFSTYSSRLSQTCVCGKIKKKPLSQRVHHCENCGAYAQRDLLSAFLACYVREDTLCVSDAKKAWDEGAEALLFAAHEKAKNASRGHRPSSFG